MPRLFSVKKTVGVQTRSSKAGAGIVIAEFVRGRNAASAKIWVETVLYKLVNQAPFYKSNFEQKKEGQEVIETLCPEKSSRLYCSDISRILIGDNVLYERNAG